MEPQRMARFDLTNMSFSYEEIPDKYKSLGGRALTSSLISDEVNPLTDSFSSENKLVLAPGLLTGSTAPCSGRISIGAKSPLTRGIKECNSGGTASHYLSGHGIKALVIEGMAKVSKGWILVVKGNEIVAEQHEALLGLGNYETVEKLQSIYGENCSIISIGPAGERGSRIATLALTDLEGRPVRHAARGGLGAVAGSKGLKAIVITKPSLKSTTPKDPILFSQVAKKVSKTLIEGKKGMTMYGTAMLVNLINGVGGLPHHNFSKGSSEEAEKISGEVLKELCDKRGGKTGHACSRGCVIRCSNVFHDQKNEYVTASLEFETIALLGSNCGVFDLDSIAQLDYLCDDLGLDTIDTGGAFGVAMETGLFSFGDAEKMKMILEKCYATEVNQQIVFHGAAETGRLLNNKRVPTVKRQTIAAYDPRVLKGNGVTYATSPMGGDHTAGNALPGRGGIDHRKPDGQIKLSKNLQINTMICDMLGLCIFTGPVDENIPDFAILVSALTGDIIDATQLQEQAAEILNIEAAYNRKAGLKDNENDLPAFFREEPLPGSGLTFDVPSEELKQLTY